VRLPRVLVIVVIVLVVLGVASCSVSFVSPFGDDDDPRGGLTDFLEGLMPGAPPVELDVGTAPCLVGDQLLIDAGAACQVVVAPTGDLRRELTLRVLGNGVVRFAVAQVTGGDTIEADPTTIPFVDDGELRREVSVVVQRDDSAVLALQCQLLGPDCVLAVNPS
jgi:hypothetical protein